MLQSPGAPARQFFAECLRLPDRRRIRCVSSSSWLSRQIDEAEPVSKASRFRRGWQDRPVVERTYLAANTAGMAKKPEQLPLSTWDIFKIAKKSTWLGSV